MTTKAALEKRKRTRKPGRAKRRPTSHTYWMFGIHAVAAALTNPARKKHRLVVSRNCYRRLESQINASGLAPEIKAARQLAAIVGREAVHQGVALEVETLRPPALESIVASVGPGARIVALDRVSDPHNVGAILRSADAFLASAVVTTRRHAPPETGALAKSASGALERAHYLRVRNLVAELDALRESGFLLIGLDEKGGQDLVLTISKHRHQRLALVLGSEGHGLRQSTREHCDELASIPCKPSLGSLNVSNAAAIALYECSIDRSRGAPH